MISGDDTIYISNPVKPTRTSFDGKEEKVIRVEKALLEWQESMILYGGEDPVGDGVAYIQEFDFFDTHVRVLLQSGSDTYILGAVEITNEGGSFLYLSGDVFKMEDMPDEDGSFKEFIERYKNSAIVELRLKGHTPD